MHPEPIERTLAIDTPARAPLFDAPRRTPASPKPRNEPTSEARNDPDEQRLSAFASALDALRREVELDLGSKDLAHIRRVVALSRRLELLGRGLIHFSVEPVAFGLGVGALWAHKALELTEIGHMALHGAYDRLPDKALHANNFRWRAPIDEVSWRAGHNIRHHQYTNISGRDPDLNFGALRLSARVPYRRAHRLQPVSNLLSWLGFAVAINLHVTGMNDIYLHKGPPESLRDLEPQTKRAAKRAFWSKTARYYGREYGLFPVLAGPYLWWKPLLGNALSEVGRDVYSAAVIYCGHVGADDYAAGSHARSRGRWYAMQVEGTRNFTQPRWASLLSGALNFQIEHHLFPRLPPNRLREIAPRVRKICEDHGVKYKTAGWGSTLRDVLGKLRRFSSPKAAPVLG
ncbi:MAG: acyl-CoA desaturase [Polyangiales bacterium]